jgi:hypothetical protein
MRPRPSVRRHRGRQLRRGGQLAGQYFGELSAIERLGQAVIHSGIEAQLRGAEFHQP